MEARYGCKSLEAKAMTKPRNDGGLDWGMEKSRTAEKLRKYNCQDSVIY